jgi:hypothetical protein
MDALDRNIMEQAHWGYAFGADVTYGHRADWSTWGEGLLGRSNEHDYLKVSAFALAATGIPFVNSERHRLILGAWGGIGRHLDRFSSFRLPAKPTGYEWESLSMPMMPSVAFNELVPRRYGIVGFEYRYAPAFFIAPYIRGGWGLVEQARFQPDGSVKYETDSMPVIGGGVFSGAPWRSQVEINYSYNFGIYSDHGGGPTTAGRHGFFVFWSKLL